MTNISQILPLVPGFIVGLTLHEFSHAWAANRLGDPTARAAGRLSLNPLAHLDLFGSLALIFAGFGWAKPVPVDSSHFRSPRRDMALVAIAGPASNILLAIALSVVLYLITFVSALFLRMSNPIITVLVQGIWINVVLAIFNLIPLPPLDGSRVLAFLVPEHWNRGYDQLERFGPMLLIGLILLANFANVPVIERVIMPVARPVFNLIIGAWLFH